MKQIINKKISRQYLENPFPSETLEERLIASRAIDLRDNHIIEDLGNGYSKIIPIDKAKLFKGFNK